MNRGPKHLFRQRRSLRLWVVAASVIGGMFLVAGLWFFVRPTGSGSSAARTSPSLTPSTQPSAVPSISGKPKIKGVVVQVLNGTTRPKLAARTSQELAKAGYTMASPGNAPTPRTVTLITYQPGFGPDAAYIQRKYLPHAMLEEAAAKFPSGAKITVVLGKDAPS